jgi:pteridine reductase
VKARAGDRPLAIVTGATAPGRVGLATACELARSGCDVVVTHRPEAPAKQVMAARKAITKAGARKVRAEPVELSDAGGAERWATRLARELPRIDVLVHNASAYRPTPLKTVTMDDVAEHMAVNTLSPLVITRALAAKLGRSHQEGGGAVVTMCDVHAMGETGQARKGYLAYSMSKAALLELTLILARELAPKVRVNAVAPGVVAFPDDDSAEVRARYLSRVPLGRSGTPEDAARAVRWLALEGTYCTGEVIRVDGGRSIT